MKKAYFHKNRIALSLGGAFFALLLFSYLNQETVRLLADRIHSQVKIATQALISPTPRPNPTPSLIPTPTASPTPTVKKYYPKPTAPPQPQTPNDWGVAKKIGEHTYTMKVGQDDRMGTPQEILQALNNYRQANGRGMLQWDDALANYSQGRADHFKSIGSTDAHAGLNDFLDNQDGFAKLGFNHVGENSYHGGPLHGTHLIEWLFAASSEHNANQLDSSWSHVGVGANDRAVNIVFGGQKR